MATRSRKGCIDCKQAKVKCDEVHPHCGTCARRRRQCSGYARPARPGATTSPTSSSGAFGGNRRASVASDTSMASSCAAVADTWSTSSTSTSTADYMRSIIIEASSKAIPIPPARGPALIPLSEILAADKPLIEVYFMRHPSEMIINNDFFISEMNGAAIALLQQSPTAVGDALAAIGENYVSDSLDSALVSNRKTRLLSRLRLINEEESSPELVLMLLLALCGVELVDPRSDGGATTLSALIDNVSMVLAFHTRQAKPLSPMAKYFTRGVARQDLLISLTRMQRTKIDTAAWLDDYSLCHADRVMGLTTTLAPILSKLAALAEDVQSTLHNNYTLTNHDFPSPDNAAVRRNDLLERESSIRTQITSWRPIRDSTMSMAMSRTFLLHAYTWRAAALLYLFRLFNCPGSSPEADAEALSMAYEVMVHISGTAQDIKLSLWPLFIAACELESTEDRTHATRLFDDICYARPIVTARRTKAFVVETVWAARDAGGSWDWMRFARCAPIPL
ncbi:fungal-specific transcription factor domain-containing protein [Aspergillus heterothallicus]